jgi:hypothetical protein
MPKNKETVGSSFTAPFMRGHLADARPIQSRSGPTRASPTGASPARASPTGTKPARASPVRGRPNQILRLRKLELEGYKARLDYRKFVLASVFAAIIIAAIPPLFQMATDFLGYTKSEAQLRLDQQNQEAERLAKQEEFRETYVKDFLVNVLNQDVELRIRFSESLTQKFEGVAQGGMLRRGQGLR